VLRGWVGSLAAAAALAILAYVASPERTSAPDDVAASLAPAAVPETRLLADGTQVRLNAGAAVVEAYTADERRVRLVRGEAYFAVTKDPARPFIVEADGVRIQAVGTAFGVALQPGLVDVLVTEGTVRVDATADTSAGDPAAAPLVTAGHRAVVNRAPDVAGAGVVVTEVDMVEVNRANAWRGGLLRLGGATLAELAAEFQRQTGRRLVLNDPELRDLRVGGRFPGDDIDGFVRVLEEHYEVRVRREADGTLILERAR
jgi:transmembrane sensor